MNINDKIGFVFVGASLTGKSQCVEKIKKHYGNLAVYLDGREFKTNKNFLFSSCNQDTKVIIIDDLNPRFPLEYFYSIMNGKLLVNQPYKKPFEIVIDKLIITLNSDSSLFSLPIGASFSRRFTVIDFPNTSLDHIIKKIINESDSK